MKKEKVESDDMELVYNGKQMDNAAKWYTTSILGNENFILHLCKR